MSKKTVSLDSLNDFANDDVRETLNSMSVSEVIRAIGSPDQRTAYASAPGWKIGDGKPMLANDDPAVMQSVGRCAAFRVRSRFPAPLPLERAVHPVKCEWCDYPEDELMKACAWAVWQSRFVTADVLEWHNDEGHRYARPGTLTGYQNPEWRRFFELPEKERERRIEAVGGKVAA